MMLLIALLACEPTPPAAPGAPAAPADAPAPAARSAVQEPLTGGPYPTLLLAQAQFAKDAAGKPKPGAALLTIWRQTPQGWTPSRLEDDASNVFHKAVPTADGILTIGAEDAVLARWRWKDGAWAREELWKKSWGGRFDRLRDLEVGDVDGDGRDDLVMATHDNGVLAVGRWKADGTLDVIERAAKPDTFVHEIEICDVDGDGKKEFFATPSGRNQSSGRSQPGQVVMGRWNGTDVDVSVVEDFGDTHVKEILCADLDGKGRGTLFAVVEAATRLEDGRARIVRPVEIRRYVPGKDGAFTHEVAATIEDHQARFLVPGDFDGDGTIDLVAAAMKSGLWLIRRDSKDWHAENIERNSSGFEHATFPADLDGDGRLELYVASDEQRELRRYTWNAASKVFDKTVIGPIPPSTITWNITATRL
jgi:hypothetical protein